MLTTSLAYGLVARDLDRSLARKAAEPSIARESAYYLANIASVQSIDAFMADERIYNYAVAAFGLEDMAFAKAYIRKILEEGVASPDALANRLNEDRFKRFVATFNFERDGAAATGTVAAGQGVVDRHVRQRLEVDQGADNEGVRLALYFQRAAPTVASAYGLLADPALWEVVATIYGFPDEMAAADIDKQAAAIDRRLDIAVLHDPEKLDRLLTRFTAAWDANEPGLLEPVLSLFDAPGSAATVDVELAVALSSLKRGGS